MNSRVFAMKSQRGWRVLAWSALVVITLLLAVVVQALVASAFGATERTALTDACRTALAAGDHVRESFLAHSCG
jgi:hypothetical protein